MHGLKAFELGFPAGLGNTSIAIAYTQGRYGYTHEHSPGTPVGVDSIIIT